LIKFILGIVVTISLIGIYGCSDKKESANKKKEEIVQLIKAYRGGEVFFNQNNLVLAKANYESTIALDDIQISIKYLGGPIGYNFIIECRHHNKCINDRYTDGQKDTVSSFITGGSIDPQDGKKLNKLIKEVQKDSE